MPSKDPIDPQAQAWMKPRKKASSPRPMPAVLLRIAPKLGKTAEELARKISADTLRRLKYPVKEIAQPDGTTRYEHDLGITDGRLDQTRR